MATPKLTLVRDSNQDTASIAGSSSDAPPEPDWRNHFPVTNGRQAADNQRARDAARAEWRLVVPQLLARGVVQIEDATAIADYCVVKARVLQLERTLAVEGFTAKGDRGGVVKHPAAVALNQYRAALGKYQKQLGLTPGERAMIPAPPDGGSGLWD